MKTYICSLLPIFAFASQTPLQALESPTPFDLLEETNTPQIFYPGNVSTSIDKFNTSFNTIDGTIFYSATSQKLGVTGIAWQSFDGKSFEPPQFVPFVDVNLPTTDVQISPDGTKLYFSSFKDHEEKHDGFHFDIWQSEQVNGKWSAPRPLDIGVNSAGNEFYPILTDSGSFYFNSDRNGNSDLFVAEFKDGTYQAPRALPVEVNSEGTEADAFFARDESFVIFVRVDTEEGLGKSDLYISFNLGNGRWSEAKHMGPEINSAEIDGSPYVTPDNKFLIFTTGRKVEGARERAMMSYADFKRTHSSHENGNLNFYYVSLDLDKYR